MSLLDTYLSELTVDTTINMFNLKEMQMKLPALKHKWIGRLIRHKQELQKLTKDKEKTSKSLVEDTLKRAPVELKNSNMSIARIVENSDTIQQMTDKIDELKLVIELLEKAEKVLSSCTFDIKNIVDINRLEQT